MPGAQPRRDWWTRVASQLRRQGKGSDAPGSGKV
jgi:hypothetical protein